MNNKFRQFPLADQFLLDLTKNKQQKTLIFVDRNILIENSAYNEFVVINNKTSLIR
jgi:hypothetical protein